jgi:hypothetical protein
MTQEPPKLDYHAPDPRKGLPTGCCTAIIICGGVTFVTALFLLLWLKYGDHFGR